MAGMTITGMLSQPFQVTTASTLSITVGASGATPLTWPASSTLWFRHYLARPYLTATGTRTDPIEAGSYLAGGLNGTIAGWQVAMQADGRWKVRNTAGAWTITWDGTGGTDQGIKRLFWFGGNLSAAQNTYASADFNPTYAIPMVCRVDPAGWQSRQDRAGAKMPDGSSYGWRSGLREMSIEFGSHFHPTDSASLTAINAGASPTSSFAALALPDESEWSQPGSVALASRTLPWDVDSFFHTVDGQLIGASLGTFQDLVAGNTNYFHVCSVDPGCFESLQWQLAEQSNPRWRHLSGVRLNFYARHSRV